MSADFWAKANDSDISHHISDDQSRSYCEIHESSSDLRQTMLEIAQHSSLRSRSRGWVNTMRFLETDENHQALDKLDRSRPSSLDSSSYEILLRLKDCSILADPSAYVAVSYCWNRENIKWFDAGGALHIKFVQKNGSARPCVIPADVLHRVLAYSKAREINAIWIDQECINQEDPIDKEDGIQSMDIVYQNSAHPIAILETCFQTQVELDIFAATVDPDFFDFDPSHIEDLGDILGALADDNWFTRAWTLQESTSAGVSMLLLIGCPGLSKPDVFGPNPEEFEISIWDFQEAMVNARLLIEEGLAQNSWPDTSDAIHVSNLADELWNRIPTIIPDRFKSRQEVSYRQTCNAAEAITFLAEREISFFPDKLAILANMCNYECRIDTKILGNPKSSFSTCALTLSILNGDMSLLTGYGDRSPHGLPTTAVRDCRATFDIFQSDDEGIPMNSYGFSWGPKPFGSLSNIVYFEECGAMLRLHPSVLLADGLKVSGTLWQFEQDIAVPNTQARFESRWKRELDLQVGEDVMAGEGRQERQRLLMYDFTMALLYELLDCGFSALARTFWLFLQPLRRSRSDLVAIHRPELHSFDDVFGRRVPRSKEDSMPDTIAQDLQKQWSESMLSVDPKTVTYNRPSIQRKLIEQVCQSGTLLFGIPVTKSTDPLSSQPRVWFDTARKGELIFTPFTQMGDEAALSVYRYQAISWHVRQTGRIVDGCEILHCLGRRRGFWRFEGLESRDHVLE
jgi:Heterokaryon incompatibility protein (HET)